MVVILKEKLTWEDFPFYIAAYRSLYSKRVYRAHILGCNILDEFGLFGYFS